MTDTSEFKAAIDFLESQRLAMQAIMKPIFGTQLVINDIYTKLKAAGVDLLEPAHPEVIVPPNYQALILDSLLRIEELLKEDKDGQS